MLEILTEYLGENAWVGQVFTVVLATAIVQGIHQVRGIVEPTHQNALFHHHQVSDGTVVCTVESERACTDCVCDHMSDDAAVYHCNHHFILVFLMDAM